MRRDNKKPPAAGAVGLCGYGGGLPLGSEVAANGGGGVGCSLPPPSYPQSSCRPPASSSMSVVILVVDSVGIVASSSSSSSLAALRRPLVPLISCPLVALRQLVVVSRLSVAPSSCAALSSSRRAGWLLRVASHLLTYPVAPPACRLVVPAGCCMSQTSVALFGCTVLLSSRRAG